MQRIAVETIIVTREYLVEIPSGESENETIQRVAQLAAGVEVIPNSEKFVDSQSIVLRDLKPGEDEDFVLRRMVQTKPLPAKKEKTTVDKTEKPAKIIKQSQSDLINELL